MKYDIVCIQFLTDTFRYFLIFKMRASVHISFESDTDLAFNWTYLCVVFVIKRPPRSLVTVL